MIWFTRAEDGNMWLAVPGLQRRQLVRIPLNTTVAPFGTLRLILRAGRVEVHYQIDASAMRSSARPVGGREVGVDKGYTEVLTDSERVKSIVQQRTDRRPDQTADPGLQPVGGERTIQLKSNVDQ
ncbi:hypothetical protein AB0L13_02560 [Saccharopolyspora shandongensis]|uniref:hypothetical protein n=1 Tax=Saccharopolyspora shandongensis TaxID=418495 RepID=UPI00343A7210